MDEESESRVRYKSSSGRMVDDLDRLRNLPDNLLYEILLKLPTKEVVKCSVLSKRWRNLWRYVPGLDLGYRDFPEYDDFVSFIDRFLGFNSESSLHKFRLKSTSYELDYEWEYDESDISHVTRLINTALERKVEHLHVLDWCLDDVNIEVDIPLRVYTCESLVSLKLCSAVLPPPKSVSLPSLKVMSLDSVRFANNLAFEMLISSCPALEKLKILSPDDNVTIMRVCSHSLLRLILSGHFVDGKDKELVVAIDAPRLETLELFDTQTDSFVVKKLCSLVKAHINIEFNLAECKKFDPNDLPKRNMIRNFLIGISTVKDMIIFFETLKAIYNFSRCEQVPLLPNLSLLRVDFINYYQWEMLPVFLESCPNLKSLSLGFSKPWKQPISITPGPHRVLPSLECVEIYKPMVDDEAQIKLATYFLENSKILKKFTLCYSFFKGKDGSVILKHLLTIPRLSSSCQVFIT